MKLIKRLTALTMLLPTTALAHPGHEAGNALLHGLLHTEHLTVLFAIAAVAVLAFVFRN